MLEYGTTLSGTTEFAASQRPLQGIVDHLTVPVITGIRREKPRFKFLKRDRGEMESLACSMIALLHM